MTNDEKFQFCLEAAKNIVSAYREEAPEGCDPQNTILIGGTTGTLLAGALVGGAVGVGGAMLVGKPGVNKPDPFHPQAFDMKKSMGDWSSIIKDGFGDASGLAHKTNTFNMNEAMKQYTTMQPEFMALQKQVGTNALSFAKGELPTDVVSSIGRAAASQGIQGGYAGGDHTGTSFTANGASSSLNLRNLGVSSLELSQMGSQLGMQVNAQAKALSPVLSSPMDFLPSLNTALGIGQQNNNDQNSANLSNIASMNTFHQNQLNADYMYRMNMMKGAMEGINMGSNIGGGAAQMGGGMSGGRNAAGETQFATGTVPRATAV